jgi:hypothetical protein
MTKAFITIKRIQNQQLMLRVMAWRRRSDPNGIGKGLGLIEMGVSRNCQYLQFPELRTVTKLPLGIHDMEGTPLDPEWRKSDFEVDPT